MVWYGDNRNLSDSIARYKDGNMPVTVNRELTSSIASSLNPSELTSAKRPRLKLEFRSKDCRMGSLLCGKQRYT